MGWRERQKLFTCQYLLESSRIISGKRPFALDHLKIPPPSRNSPSEPPLKTCLTNPKMALRETISRIFVACAAIGLLGAGVRYVSQLEVTGFTVDGHNRATTVAVRHLADVREGERLVTLDLDKIVESVVRHPWVKDAEVSRYLDGTVTIRVEEHNPVMLLSHSGLFHVSDEGAIFVRARSEDLNYPILTGVESHLIEEYPVVAQKIIDDALEIFSHVVSQGVVEENALSEIHFDEDLGFDLLLNNRTRLRFGLRSPEVQVTRLRAMLVSGLELSTPQDVDLDLDGMAIATPFSL